MPGADGGTQHEGQQVIAVTSELLRRLIVTGQSPAEDAHLGALLAWIERAGADALGEAARRSIVPAASMLTRAEDDLVEALLRVAKKGGSSGRRAQAGIEQILSGAALREWDLLSRAKVLRRDGRVIEAVVLSVYQPRRGCKPCRLRLYTDQTVLRVRSGTTLRLVNGRVRGRVTSVKVDPRGGHFLDIEVSDGVRSRPNVGARGDWTDSAPMDVEFLRRKITRRQRWLLLRGLLVLCCHRRRRELLWPGKIWVLWRMA